MAIDHAREMTRHQRALIDTSFEEGQYESGIIAIDQLRSGACLYPSAPHIRQLIYLALYTPPANEEKLTLEPASPSKIASRQQKLAHTPTPAASSAAQRLLVSLISSTPPEMLFRGLPSYQNPLPPDEDDGDSFVAKQARCIAQAKDCWAFLKEGFIHESTRVPMPSRWHRRLSHDDEDERASPAVVAESAWPVLEWLILGFQADELRNRYSPLLLSQIPLPRSSSGERWETNAVLDIVFHGLGLNERRQSLSVQLLIMLIHLWSARLIDMQMFVASVHKRISTSQDDRFLALLNHLSATPSASEFQVTICHRYLSDLSAEPKTRRRPKPQARVQPRAARGAQSMPQLPMDSQSNIAGQSTMPSQSLVPSFDSILQLLKDEPCTASGDRSLTLIKHVKFHLLMSFGTLQEGLKLADRDPSWLHLLSSGEAMNLILVVFGGSRDSTVEALQNVTKAHLRKWVST